VRKARFERRNAVSDPPGEAAQDGELAKERAWERVLPLESMREFEMGAKRRRLCFYLGAQAVPPGEDAHAVPKEGSKCLESWSGWGRGAFLLQREMAARL